MKNIKTQKSEINIKRLISILKVLIKENDIEVLHLAIQSIIEDLEGR